MINKNKLMRKYLLLFSTALVLVLCFSSCTPITNFDESLLYGKWVDGTEYYRFDVDGTGATWDTADDVTEAEAQEFTWTLEGADLTIIHILQIGGAVPKYYTMTSLTATTLEFEDYTSKKFSYTKVN